MKRKTISLFLITVIILLVTNRSWSNISDFKDNIITRKAHLNKDIFIGLKLIKLIPENQIEIESGSLYCVYKFIPCFKSDENSENINIILFHEQPQILKDNRYGQQNFIIDVLLHPFLKLNIEPESSLFSVFASLPSEKDNISVGEYLRYLVNNGMVLDKETGETLNNENISIYIYPTINKDCTAINQHFKLKFKGYPFSSSFLYYIHKEDGSDVDYFFSSWTKVEIKELQKKIPSQQEEIKETDTGVSVVTPTVKDETLKKEEAKESVKTPLPAISPPSEESMKKLIIPFELKKNDKVEVDPQTLYDILNEKLDLVYLEKNKNEPSSKKAKIELRPENEIAISNFPDANFKYARLDLNDNDLFVTQQIDLTTAEIKSLVLQVKENAWKQITKTISVDFSLNVPLKLKTQQAEFLKNIKDIIKDSSAIDSKEYKVTSFDLTEDAKIQIKLAYFLEPKRDEFNYTLSADGYIKPVNLTLSKAVDIYTLKIEPKISTVKINFSHSDALKSISDYELNEALNNAYKWTEIACYDEDSNKCDNAVLDYSYDNMDMKHNWYLYYFKYLTNKSPLIIKSSSKKVKFTDTEVKTSTDQINVPVSFPNICKVSIIAQMPAGENKVSPPKIAYSFKDKYYLKEVTNGETYILYDSYVNYYPYFDSTLWNQDYKLREPFTKIKPSTDFSVATDLKTFTVIFDYIIENSNVTLEPSETSLKMSLSSYIPKKIDVIIQVSILTGKSYEVTNGKTTIPVVKKYQKNYFVSLTRDDIVNWSIENASDGKIVLGKTTPMKIYLDRIKTPIEHTFSLNTSVDRPYNGEITIKMIPSNSVDPVSLSLNKTNEYKASYTMEWPKLRVNENLKIEIDKPKGYDINLKDIPNKNPPAESLFSWQMNDPQIDVIIDCTSLPFKKVFFIDLTENSMRHTQIDTAIRQLCEKYEYKDIFLFLTNGSAWKSGQNKAEIIASLNDLYTLAPSIGNIFTDIKQMADIYKISNVYNSRYYNEYHFILSQTNASWIDRRLEQFEETLSNLSIEESEKIIIHTNADSSSLLKLTGNLRYIVKNDLILE